MMRPNLSLTPSAASTLFEIFLDAFTFSDAKFKIFVHCTGFRNLVPSMEHSVENFNRRSFPLCKVPRRNFEVCSLTVFPEDTFISSGVISIANGLQVLRSVSDKASYPLLMNGPWFLARHHFG